MLRGSSVRTLILASDRPASAARDSIASIIWAAMPRLRNSGRTVRRHILDRFPHRARRHREHSFVLGEGGEHEFAHGGRLVRPDETELEVSLHRDPARRAL